MRFGPVRLALLAVLAAALLAPTAAGSPATDFTAVANDYAHDGNITNCRFTQGQLENALGQISPDLDVYATGLRGEINREIKRWKDGDCAGKRGGADLRIVRVQPKGGARAESVTIKNASKKTVNLRRYALRDSTDHTITFRTMTLKAGKQLTVVTGCRAGRKTPLRKGSRYYACRKKQVWDDAGDTVELVSPVGALLAQKTY